MSIMLTSDRLAVEVALPGEPPNTTCRFDRAGFITQVTLDGKYSFCTREPGGLAHPSTGGVGLCSEYQANAPAKEAQIGHKFIKPGIGLFVKTDEKDYQFFKQYQAEFFPITWEQRPGAITFLTEPVSHGGYALRMRKELTVAGTSLTMAMQVTNVGEKSIELNEYCHNFITIGSLPLGPAYHLEFSAIKPQDGRLSPQANGTFTASGRTFSFSAYNPGAAMVHLTPEEILPDLPFYWELSHTASPVRLRETDSFTPHNAAVWAIDHIISPEVFHRVTLLPGKEDSWARTWTCTLEEKQ